LHICITDDFIQFLQNLPVGADGIVGQMNSAEESHASVLASQAELWLNEIDTVASQFLTYNLNYAPNPVPPMVRPTLVA
jgi:hypothetical protein